MDNGRTLPELRLALVAARSHLRRQEMALQTHRAITEQAIIDQAGGEAATGSNADARKRYLLRMIGDSADYCNRENVLEQARSEVEELTARIANAEDERRERERLTREKLADALLISAFSDVDAETANRALRMTRNWHTKTRPAGAFTDENANPK